MAEEAESVRNQIRSEIEKAIRSSHGDHHRVVGVEEQPVGSHFPAGTRAFSVISEHHLGIHHFLVYVLNGVCVIVRKTSDEEIIQALLHNDAEQ